MGFTTTRFAWRNLYNARMHIDRPVLHRFKHLVAGEILFYVCTRRCINLMGCSNSSSTYRFILQIDDQHARDSSL